MVEQLVANQLVGVRFSLPAQNVLNSFLQIFRALFSFFLGLFIKVKLIY